MHSENAREGNGQAPDPAPCPREHVPGDFSECLVVLALLAACSPVYAIWMLRDWLGRMHVGLPWVLAVPCFAAASCILYGRFVAPWRVRVSRYRMPLGKAGKFYGLRLGFLSDFHLGSHKNGRFLQGIVDMLNAHGPDVVLLGGDYLRDYDADGGCLRPLRHIRAPGGVLAVFGNHDWYGMARGDHARKPGYPESDARYRSFLESNGVRILSNEHVLCQCGGTVLGIAGLDDYLVGKSDVRKALQDMPNGHPRLLLTHVPGVLKEFTPADWRVFDLILSGHTHGGQVRLPGLGALHLPDDACRPYVRGHYKVKETRLIVSTGIGETGPKVRFFCPPEIVIVDI